jgi:hypothetical protein
MTTPKISIRIAGMAALAILLPLTASAQFRHPRYLSARSDLRRATLLMRIPDEPNVTRDMNAGADMLERAIRELDAAAMFDRRDIDDHPPVDTRMGRGGRFREILRLIDAARDDISREEDNPRAREWRNRAFRLMDDASALVRRGGYDKFRDDTAYAPPPPPPPIHPRYASAIADLRYARALLWREDWRDIMRDQHAAVDEIDRAIGEARRAAIDDGKNPDDHPPIEARMGWEGRFRKALEVLNAAESDMSQAETNPNAAGWRNAARQNIENAKRYVGAAMRGSWWR